MTVRSAERITGLYLRRMENGVKWKYGLYADEACQQLLKTQEAYEAKAAIQMLVEWNYRQVSRQVFTEQNYLCFHCGGIKPLQVDHIVERSKGRVDLRSNLRGLCPPCHRRRHDNRTLVAHPRVLEAVRKHGWRWTLDSEKIGWVRV